MTRWRIMIPQWEVELESEDEGYALMDAESRFNFMSEARTELVETGEESLAEEGEE